MFNNIDCKNTMKISFEQIFFCLMVPTWIFIYKFARLLGGLHSATATDLTKLRIWKCQKTKKT